MSATARTVQAPGAPARDPALGYLRSAVAATPLQALLLLTALYFLAATAAYAWVFIGVLGLGLVVFLGAPRWVCYAILGVALLLLLATFVFQISNGPQDRDSDRDEAVEIAAQALLDGQNPWARTTQRSTPITTGPASIILALPSVWWFHRVNELTFVLYIAFFAFLLAGDLRCENDTFLSLGLFFLAGFFDFHHTLYWSLDELYYAYVALVLAWIAVRRRWFATAGACLAFAVGSRASYVLPVFGFVCWYWFSRPASAGALLVLGCGALVGLLLIVAPFWLVAGRGLPGNNMLGAAWGLLQTGWPETNPLFRGLDHLRDLIGATAMGALKLAASFAVIWFASLHLRRLELPHPFWHLCLGGFLATVAVYRAGLEGDYVLCFVIPAFMAIAYSSAGRETATHATPSPAQIEGRAGRR